VLTVEEQRNILQKDSPHAAAHHVEQYLSALSVWLAADRNVREHGPIVTHPRTGAPFENPYLAARDRAWKSMVACRGVKADRLWARLRTA
jgi:phage terminase small subunit